MKVYLYYLIDKGIIKYMSDMHLLEGINNPGYYDENYFFYAYTTKKRIAKKFESMRNMKVFIKKVIDMDDDEYSDLVGRFSSLNHLTEHPLLCGEKQRIIIPITTGEYWYCVESRSESMYSYLETINKIDPRIYSKKTLNLLRDLGYLDLFPDHSHMLPIDMDKFNNVREFFTDCGWTNELGVLFCLYKDLFIPENVISEGEYE